LNDRVHLPFQSRIIGGPGLLKTKHVRTQGSEKEGGVDSHGHV
jgi:hypothetical protein